MKIKPHHFHTQEWQNAVFWNVTGTKRYAGVHGRRLAVRNSIARWAWLVRAADFDDPLKLTI
ncbi:hypothetical protein M422DRAFT_31120 [Sphaerobolus stellatus SS14]|uniref:Uncharacterized protein n=1 Tax=Sphaerobolus stellatus (strain SS14) TaxID=990650 RepID=A0A0C9UHG2_SPHS4|nr:hypothetical protein M422DRAFT_37362 [Sphaerobolus stellatus SS14]KIJ43046.1 hypothetical protein M422DRAFT_31120 [Sphaerobolus stellatus SS14]